MQTIEFEGQQHQFPDDFSDQDIAKALSSVAPAQAAAPVPVQNNPVVPEPDVRAPSTPAAPVNDGMPAEVPGMGAPYVPSNEPLTSRGALLGVNAVGRGLSDLVGMGSGAVEPSKTGVREALAFGLDKAGLGRPGWVDAPWSIGELLGRKAGIKGDITSPEGINLLGSWLESKLGVPDVKPETFKEKAASNAIEFGAQGALGGGTLARAAAKRGAEMVVDGAVPKALDDLLRPYMVNPAKTVAGDTVAGAGAGSALTASQAIPEDIREKGHGAVGAAADLLAMLTGGVGAGTAFNVVTGTPGKFSRVAAGSKPADLPLDPETKLPFSNKDADAAAAFLKGKAIDPAAAAQTIGDTVAALRAEGRPIPSTGLISGDTGLEAVDRGQRVKNSTGSILTDATAEAKKNYSFGERDTALRDAAVADVNALRPAEANPDAFPERAAEIAAAQREQAQRGVDQATGKQRAVQTASRPAAEAMTPVPGEGEAASRNIDQMYRGTRDAEHQQNRELFNAPVLTGAEVPVAHLLDTADNIRASASRAAPLDPVVQKYVDRFRDARPAEGDRPAVPGFEPGETITMQDVNNLRAELDGDIANNLKNGNVVRQLRQLKDTVGTYAEDLAEEGHPAGEAAAAALENHATRVAPNFREGAGGELDQALKRNANIRPSETATTFLTRPEDTADLMRIAALRGNAADTAANARTWLFDQLAQKGVTKDGMVDPDKLTRWRNANSGVLDNVPGLSDEVNGMVADARKGADLNARYGAEIKAAEANKANVEKNINQGPLGAVAGKSPEKAADAIFASKNPLQTARELKATVGKNPEAMDGMKAAVAERLAAKVSGVNPANVSEGTQNINYAQLVKEFNKNEQVLSAIYSPEEMNLLRRAHKTLEPLALRQGQATTGSITAESTEAAWRPFEIAAKLHFGILKGGGLTRTAKLIGKALFGDATNAPNRLIGLSSFDPDLARLLLTRDVKEAGSPGWNNKLQMYLRRAQAVRDVSGDNQQN